LKKILTVQRKAEKEDIMKNTDNLIVNEYQYFFSIKIYLLLDLLMEAMTCHPSHTKHIWLFWLVLML